MEKVFVTEQETQSIQKTYLVDTKTGEIIPVYSHGEKKHSLCYTRDSRKMKQCLNEHKKRQDWIEARKLTSIDDVRSAEDLEALLGSHSNYSAKIHQQGASMLSNAELSRRALSLAMKLIHEKLIAQNFCIVTNEEIAELARDASGNYGKYLTELKGINFCKVKDLSKTTKLIIINPVYGYRGYIPTNDHVSYMALERYYGNELGTKVCQFDENEWLEAA